MYVSKLLLTMAVGGTLATGTYLTKDYWLSSSKEEKNTVINKSISQSLVENKYTLLDTNSQDKWADVLEKYKKAYPNGITEVSKLQSYCRDLLNKQNFEKSDYKEARRWCVSPQSVNDRLSLFGKKSLSTEASKNTDDSLWKEKISSHKTTSSNKLNREFNGDDVTNLKAIKEDCKALNGKTNDLEGFEEDLYKSILWCSVNA
ncbi:hypothetical protein MHC_04845 [Mycoplasma haemocanis str. Illinois]|uniref:Uncharacterized protein n=1 Tax=Mycoplasma haemocanis (strain Illinois) TaxID=1111676 RepID=H6N853_MYCHN|nr:hypothetical protein [Mycoplasma haemocanis]AEW45825.1 hypothetical protein MHC_04845 [Mycoplasma haemocanis str. Illinois]